MAPPSADAPTNSSITSTEVENLTMAPPKGSKVETLLEGVPGPKFEDPLQMREYQKGRLALAFRIFAKLGFDEGVAGHITLRVCQQLRST
jgi:hypothetical protein